MRILRWLFSLLVLGFVGYGVATSYQNWIRTDARPPARVPPESIRIEVINASGELGAGKAAAEFLARQGFDVYGSRNNDEIIPRTRIVDRRDPGMGFAQEVNRVLFVPGTRIGPLRLRRGLSPIVRCRIDSLLYLEVVVILGEDYGRFFPIEPRPY